MNNTEITLTVIISVYNASKYLRECLDSICNQSFRSLEIICVNDGSTDNSLDILEEYASKDSRFIVLNQDNQGQGAARNKALDIARGCFVIGLDSDDYIHPQCYEIALQHMKDDVDMVTFAAQPFGENEAMVRAAEPYFNARKTGRITISPDSIQYFNNNIWNKIFRRDIIEQYKIRFPEGLWYEDCTFTHQYLSVISTVYSLPDKLYYYRKRADSTMGKTMSKHIKALDILECTSKIYEFYQKNGVWEKLLPQVGRLAQNALIILRSVPETSELSAKIKCYRWMRRWKLAELFPNSTKIQAAGSGSLVDLVDRYICERSKKPDDNKNHTNAAPKKQQPVYEVRYLLFTFVPILTIHFSHSQETGQVKIRAKLFSFIPLMSCKGTDKKQKYYLFNFIPLWKCVKSV